MVKAFTCMMCKKKDAGLICSEKCVKEYYKTKHKNAIKMIEKFKKGKKK